MRKTYWRLRYDREVTAKLYELRDSGYALHDQIKALKFEDDPFEGARRFEGEPERYEFEYQGWWIGFEKSRDPQDVNEPTLVILYIERTIE